MSTNALILTVHNDDKYKYHCDIRSFMNVEIHCQTMKAVFSLIHEYEIDWVRKDVSDTHFAWHHTVLPKTWVETYSEKAHNDFYYPVR